MNESEIVQLTDRVATIWIAVAILFLVITIIFAVLNARMAADTEKKWKRIEKMMDEHRRGKPNHFSE